MNPTVSNAPVRQRALRALGFGAVLLLVLAIQYREQISNHFTVLYGDRYDAAIVTTILEHWYNTVRGLAHWNQANYFYPYAKTLGHTDGYFLLGLIYSLIRPFGVDPFLASEMTGMIAKGLGFAAFFLLCRQVFKISFWWAVLAAALFCLSNNATIHGQRLQLTTVAIAPMLALLLYKAWEGLQTARRQRFIGYGVASGMLLGAWSITCFYTTWFFIFFTIFLLAILVLSAGAAARKQLGRQLWDQKGGVVIVLLATLASLYPLLSVYLPKARETGMRPFETVLGNTVPLQGILQVGNENILFGRMYNQFLHFITPAYAPNGEYYNCGIAPVLFILFAIGAVLTLRRRHPDAGFGNGLLLRSVCLATIVTWLFALNIGGYSAWYFVYQFFPGARALAVVSAYQIFLSLPVIIIAIRYLSTRDLRVPHALAAVLAALLVLEELNGGYITLVRADEVKRVMIPVRPPAECTSFFAEGWANQATVSPMSEWINNHYAHNVSAMLIAELNQIPTINGVASFNPPDWNFERPNNADYHARIREYAQRHQVKGLCSFNLESQVWQSTW